MKCGTIQLHQHVIVEIRTSIKCKRMYSYVRKTCDTSQCSCFWILKLYDLLHYRCFSCRYPLQHVFLLLLPEKSISFSHSAAAFHKAFVTVGFQIPQIIVLWEKQRHDDLDLELCLNASCDDRWRTEAFAANVLFSLLV